MSTPENDKPVIEIYESPDKVSIQISANPSETIEDSWTVLAHKAITTLFDKVAIGEVYYIDDIFEIIGEFSEFSGKINALLAADKKEVLKAKITDIDFELPDAAFAQHLRVVWENNAGKRGMYFTKIIDVSGEDVSFKKDLDAKDKIEEFLPDNIVLKKLSPTEWHAQKDAILGNLNPASKTLFLFDNIFTHSPAPLTGKQGIEFVQEIIDRGNIENIICGLVTHTVEVKDELVTRRQLCTSKNIPIANFFLISKKRTLRALQFADGIKKALLNTSCETIKQRTIEIIKKAQKATLDKLEELDAYAFDHIVINSSFEEGVWEPETIFRINDFLFGDFARQEILNDAQYKDEVNRQLEMARVIAGVKTTDTSYDDHLKLRSQELYLSSTLLNPFNSPIENGDIFSVKIGRQTKTFILVSQQCDMMIRKDGERKSKYGTLLEIGTYTETGLTAEIEKFYKKDILRQHYFADKYKLQYFNSSAQEVKAGVVDFNSSVVIDMAVIDMAVYNSNGECKLDLAHLSELSNSIQNSWRTRYDSIVKRFQAVMAEIESVKPSIDAIALADIKGKVWNRVMPTISFLEELGIKPSYNNGVFDFGIKRIMRYREPSATILLNRYTRHLSREAEDHDFAK